MSSIVGTATSAFYDRSKLAITDLRKQAEALQQKIGSGEKLARSSDSPVDASRLRTLMRAEKLSAIDMANANRANADLTLADDALQSFADFIIRARELATQAGNATLSPAQRAGIGTELAQIHTSLISLANARDSAGHALFGGEASGNAYALDGAGNAFYAGTASAGELPLGDGQSVSRGLTGPEFLNFTGPSGPTDLFATIKALGEALQGAAADPAGAARDALDTLGSALEKVTTSQTIVGTRLAWIELTTDRRIELSEMRADEQAEIGGTDIGETVAELQNIMLVLEASQASFARLSQLSLFDQLR